MSDPSFVPTSGGFFLHDDRFGSGGRRRGGKGGKGGRGGSRGVGSGGRTERSRNDDFPSKGNDDDGLVWCHDKFEEVAEELPRPSAPKTLARRKKKQGNRRNTNSLKSNDEEFDNGKHQSPGETRGREKGALVESVAALFNDFSSVNPAEHGIQPWQQQGDMHRGQFAGFEEQAYAQYEAHNQHDYPGYLGPASQSNMHGFPPAAPAHGYVSDHISYNSQVAPSTPSQGNPYLVQPQHDSNPPRLNVGAASFSPHKIQGQPEVGLNENAPVFVPGRSSVHTQGPERTTKRYSTLRTGI